MGTHFATPMTRRSIATSPPKSTDKPKKWKFSISGQAQKVSRMNTPNQVSLNHAKRSSIICVLRILFLAAAYARGAYE